MKNQHTQVTVDTTTKDAIRYLDIIGLKSMYDDILDDSLLKEIFSDLQQIEKQSLKKTMSPIVKRKQRLIFDGKFAKFQEVFADFICRTLLSIFFEEKVKNPTKTDYEVIEKITSKKTEIRERTISYAYNELLQDIRLEQIRHGYQPYEVVPQVLRVHQIRQQIQ